MWNRISLMRRKETEIYEKKINRKGEIEKLALNEENPRKKDNDLPQLRMDNIIIMKKKTKYDILKGNLLQH